MTIPAQLHFCWIGRTLPWAYVFGILSAADRSDLSPVVLHHTDELADTAEIRALARAGRVVLSPVSPDILLAEVGRILDLGDDLAALYRRLGNAIARSDLLRAAILYREGGIYLDLDTVTVATLRPLLDATHFVGTERVVWPGAVRRSRSPLVWARHLGLDLLRKLLRRLAFGWAVFRRLERWFPSAVNNAAMGAERRSPFVGEYLRAMLAVPAIEIDRPYAFGPDLLQAIVARRRPPDLVLHHPHVFSPLGPEVSEHWFRNRRGPAVTLLPAATRVVHWYASVHTAPRIREITPDSVRRRRDTEAYSRLVHDLVAAMVGSADRTAA